MSDIAITPEPDIITVTDGPALIQLVVPIVAEESVILSDIMTDNALIRPLIPHD